MRGRNAARSTGIHAKFCALLLGFALILGWPERTPAYAVLAHEAIIDTAWETHLRPLLLKRYPNSTPQELKEAHGFVYGGAIIQDMGYYPHGNHFVSDLTHYLRSGDFILALLRDAQDVREYAFALGALSHYAADIDGHRVGTTVRFPSCTPSSRRSTASSSPMRRTSWLT